MKKAGDGLKIPQRLIRAFLIVLAALLTFGGPTYIAYVLESLGVPPLQYLFLGLAFFTAGVILFLHLLGEEAASKPST